MSYNYQIKWVGRPKQMFKLIKLIGVRSLDKICLKDIEGKVLDTYTGFIMYGGGIAEEETIKYIKRQFKKNDKLYYVEVLRR